MTKREDGIFEKPPEQTQKPASVDGVVIHVMPKEFLGRPPARLEEPRPEQAIGEKRPEPIKAVAPLPVPSPARPAKRTRGSRLPVVLLGVGMVVIAILAVGGYYVLQSLEEEPSVIVEEPTGEDPEPPVEEPTKEPQQPVIVAGRDTDSDGLTDREEALYGTDFRNPDTDGDTFLDGNEVFHRYDPLGYSPSTLLDTGSVIQYSAPDDVYELTYPRTWTLSTTMEGVMLRSATGTSVDVLAEPNEEGLAFETWFQTVYATEEDDPGNFQQGTTKSGYPVYMSTDKMETFVIVGDVVFVFIYNLGSSTTIDYLQTFQMIVNSFVVN